MAGSKDWLAAILTIEERRDLKSPLLLDDNGQPTRDPIGPKVKAFIDPTLFASDGREWPKELLHRPHPLSQMHVLQAARFTAALLKVCKALTGHENIVLHTFREVLIASTGVFPFYKGQFVGLYKQQFNIGRGVKEWRVGRAGRFILPNLRLLVRDVTLAQFKKEMGVDLDICRLDPFRPDHLIEKLDYDMTWRNRNYGIVFSYDYFPTDVEWKAWTGPCEGKPVLVLSGNDPHPSDEDFERYHHVLRLMTPEDMERLDAEGRLTLEAEKPRLLEMFDKGMNFSPEERMGRILAGIPEEYRAKVMAEMKAKGLI